MRSRRARLLAPVVVAACAAAAMAAPSATAGAGSSLCAPGGPAVRHEGAVEPDDARSYLVLPIDVAAGTTRVELAYGWADRATPLGTPPSTALTQTVFDLGLWDEDGYQAATGFRGWSGSRQGRTASGQPPVFVQTDAATRGYLPGVVEPGRWWADLGVAAVGPNGATWWVEARCLDVLTGPAATPALVDASHVADPAPGWYFGDLHMHGYHSAPDAPRWQEVVDSSRAAGLDFLPITDYVTSAHWYELGPVQAANPDVIIWPGREIITYHGHANALGETPSVLEYRHGFDDGDGYQVSLADIQQATLDDGALFQVNHPTIFPGPLFHAFCRGCAFELADEIDWDGVDTIEVVTGPVVANPSDAGAPMREPSGQNPFVITAIDLWHRLLLEGHKITAVSGSDSKGTEPNDAERARRGYGSSATAVHATSLSRAALAEGLRAGRAWIAARGRHASPHLEMEAVGPAGERATFGDTLATDRAEVTVTVRHGAGQTLSIIRDGLTVAQLPVTSGDFTHTFTALRAPGSGPLGTFWRVDVQDEVSLTAIGNPLFLAGG